MFDENGCGDSPVLYNFGAIWGFSPLYGFLGVNIDR